MTCLFYHSTHAKLSMLDEANPEVRSNVYAQKIVASELHAWYSITTAVCLASACIETRLDVIASKSLIVFGLNRLGAISAACQRRLDLLYVAVFGRAMDGIGHLET